MGTSGGPVVRFRSVPLSFAARLPLPALPLCMVGARGAGHKNWFRELFGFDEGSSYSTSREAFAMDGDVLVCETSKFPRMVVGPWETPSVGELRARLSASPSSTDMGGLKFQHLPAPSGVVPLIMDPQNAGSVFQAASQFNCLEMISP